MNVSPAFFDRYKLTSIGDLLVEYSITFPSDGQYEAFRTSDGVAQHADNYDFGWNPSTRTVTYGWRRRRRRR